MSAKNVWIAVLVIVYAVGLFGTLYVNESLMRLTPANLLLSAGVLFWFHNPLNKSFLTYAGIVFVMGFVLEWVGVETGKIFGQYFYGENLGVKLLDIPLIIGLNWLILSYCTTSVVSQWMSAVSEKFKPFVIPAVAALIMVFIDYWIEQVAPRYDFWYWKDQAVPLQNYTAWFFFAFAFNFLFVRLKLFSYNPIALPLLLLQAVFFIGLNLLYN